MPGLNRAYSTEVYPGVTQVTYILHCLLFDTHIPCVRNINFLYFFSKKFSLKKSMQKMLSLKISSLENDKKKRKLSQY